MTKSHPLRRGFTIIELMVVIAVIAILSAIIVSSVSEYKAKSRDSRRVQDILQIQNALNLYRNDHGQYPASGGASLPNGQWTSSNDTSWSTLATALAPYITALPKDPINTAGLWGGSGNVYSYYSLDYGCSQDWYMLVYSSERNTAIPSPGVTACDGTVFNYPTGVATGRTVTIGASGK